jgi:cytochrome c553
MTLIPRLIALATLALVAAAPAVVRQRPAPPSEAAVEFFEKKIRPVLVNNCYNCHSADTNSQGGLRVDDRNGLLTGGKRGPAIVPGHPEKSLLITAIHQTGPLKMPPKKQLTAEQVADLSKWITDGAAWPGIKVPVISASRSARYAKLKKEHWAWQPLRQTKVPAVKAASWPRSDVDRFLLSALEGKGLAPVGDADRETLLRRVTFDLTGLPPTVQEIDAFVADRSADAFEKVVDRLLSSPAYGERWGRYWLDVARYGESTGSARNLPYPHAWKYRDYVLDSFNADKPYDRFVREQIAGDLLPAKDKQQKDEQAIATGFLALGVKDVNQRFTVRFVMDNVDEQIDTVSRAFLGLTASCARCHDHKFDPIPQKDYYALAGIFTSTDLCAGVRNKMGGGGLDYYDTSMLLPVGSGLAKPDPKAEAEIARLKMVRLQGELLALNDPAAKGFAAVGVRDAKKIADTELRVRGEAEKLGPAVPRGFLTLIDVPDAPKVNAKQSGRLELAEWLTSPRNALALRVIVNRVWQQLFGAGLVRSTDNFGVTGEAPSHPELLDHLAARFVEDGWSIKKLVRSLVLTRAYQLAGDAPKANVEVDPANRLLWRHAPRRLTAEEMRDGILAAAGTLDRTRVAGSPAMTLKVVELANTSPLARQLAEEANQSRSRSVYLPLLRTLTPSTLEAFDPAEQGMVSGGRDATTVAPQALFLLNDPFVRRNALALANQILKGKNHDGGRIDAAYRATLGRPATAKEVERIKAYLADYEADYRELLQADASKKTERPADAKAAAWASFTQALFGSAEFRYLR